jgi:hypothetical protein
MPHLRSEGRENPYLLRADRRPRQA